MIKYNQALCVIFLLFIFPSIAYTQNSPSPSINSPYTRYGYGNLSDQSFGNSRAMGGIGYGLRDKSQINPLNPASYTSIDSLTFLLEGGFSLENTNFSDGNIKKNAKNSSFDYIAMQFRLNRKFAASVGFLPFSNVGYSLSSQETVTGDENKIAYSSFNGTGGLNQLYVGLGFKIIDNLSIGTNISYLFGKIEHTSYTQFSDGYADRSRKMNSVKINDYKLDLGLQYTQKLSKNHSLILGAVYSLKHKLNNDAYNITELLAYSSSAGGYYNVDGQQIDTIRNGFEFPHSFGAGLTYLYKEKLTLGIDYTLQKWNEVNFFGQKGNLKDRSKISFGAEYIPNYMNKNYFNRIKYRGGFHYSSPYIKVKGEDGAKEYGVSLGLGLPVYRSLINISGEYVKVKPKNSNLIEENILRVNVGITFNERWFAKWKVQ